MDELSNQFDPLERLLNRARRADRFVAAPTRVAAALWPWPPAVVGVLALDAVEPLPPWARAALALGLSGWLVFGLCRARLTESHRRRDETHWARIFERRCDVSGNALVNAWQLRALAAGGGVGAVLASRAVREGRAAATRCDQAMGGRSPVDWRPVIRVGAMTVAALLTTLIVVLAVPRLVQFGLPRLVQPWADHPPFTWLDFDVRIRRAGSHRDVVAIGDDVAVEVVITGGSVEAARLIVAGNEGPAGVSLEPIERGQNGATFAGRLRDVREPLEFHVETEAGRSVRHRLVPAPIPRPIHETATVETTGEAASFERSDGEIVAAMGETVTWTVDASLPLAEAIVDGDAEAQVSVDPGGQAVVVRISVLPGRHEWAMRLVGESGMLSDSTLRLVVEGVTPTSEIGETADRQSPIAGSAAGSKLATDGGKPSPGEASGESGTMAAGSGRTVRDGSRSRPESSSSEARPGILTDRRTESIERTAAAADAPPVIVPEDEWLAIPEEYRDLVAKYFLKATVPRNDPDVP